MLDGRRTSGIALERLSKAFGDAVIIPGLTAELRAGEFTVILGPSGCGKSTLLNMIAGLERVSGGVIRIGAREVQHEQPKDRGIAMVFQNYALYPHMTVADNIGYALKVARVAKDERTRRIEGAAKVVDLGDYLDRRPGALSGGQRQRVAIARAIVREPEVLLYDEPLSNLDAKLRHEMRVELDALHRRIGATSVFVTHDQVEAMTLADRIMILNEGRIEQFDTPKAIYHQPASTFVAGFIGAPPMNLVPAVGHGGALRLADGTLLGPTGRDGPVTVGIRPERVRVEGGSISARIVYREDLGSHGVLTARLAGGEELRIATPLGRELPGDGTVHLAMAPGDLHVFDRETGAALS